MYEKFGREKTPRNYKEVLKSPYKKFWINAINEEVAALHALGVFRVGRKVDVPKGYPILRLLQILKTKMRQYDRGQNR